MGAGKTTIGKILAKELDYEFFDSDREIEKRSGANIPWIFDVEGESGFREREVSVIQELSARRLAVVATGGGAMMRAENRDQVKKNGYVIYLNVSVDQQFKRTHKDRNRPLLQGERDPFQVLSELYSARDPIYREVADLIVDTDKKSIKSTVKAILHALGHDDSANSD